MTKENTINWFIQEKYFLVVFLICILLAGGVTGFPAAAMWLGFAFAAYSAISNDSIQTLGTFISSNLNRKWWVLWLYIGGIFLATMIWGWVSFDGDVSYGRLASKGFDEAPASLTFLQVGAPLVLLLLTRLRMPVSTSILLLSCFATEASSISRVLFKSVGGYAVAFVAAIALWGTLGRWMNKKFVGTPHPGWYVAQFVTTGALWAVWLAQDAANIAIFLPRSLNVTQLLAFLGFIFFGLGLLFYQRGEKIQEVVSEKKNVADVRAAAVIDLLYALILIYKLTVSTIPMSTTWVFIGLLSGREIAMNWAVGDSLKSALKMARRDLLVVAAGLLISLMVAAAVNPVLREAWL